MAAVVPRYRNLIIRSVLVGCTNRPFYLLRVQPRHKDPWDEAATLEQVGTYDPMPNAANEKLVALNLDRIKYWLGTGAKVTRQVEQLLGLCGFFPVHPMSYIEASRNRKKAAAKAQLEATDSSKQEATG
ncbi:putative 28S ribosomal protein S16, mitochondrial [Hypsibius exemplaris]|uniref:Small ribosomal subunit protein bS16m n=1 Tax=Hypsibius exemplaris TaxID=2072580 RepID=A0A1W0WS72_HYPEX|nr:putative 28S ribosomal protein S16, mitochondrial [Hypsibius exemplaris]